MATLYGFIGKTPKTLNANLTVAEQVQDYLGKVAAHIPGEIISIYLIGKAIFPGTNGEVTVGIWAVVCWALALVLRYFGTQGKGRVINIIMTFLAFPIWVMAIGGSILGFTLGVQISTLVVLVFAVIAGIIYNNK